MAGKTTVRVVPADAVRDIGAGAFTPGVIGGGYPSTNGHPRPCVVRKVYNASPNHQSSFVGKPVAYALEGHYNEQGQWIPDPKRK